jgi:hypothetical protein
VVATKEVLINEVKMKTKKEIETFLASLASYLSKRSACLPLLEVEKKIHESFEKARIKTHLQLSRALMVTYNRALEKSLPSKMQEPLEMVPLNPDDRNTLINIEPPLDQNISAIARLVAEDEEAYQAEKKKTPQTK